MDEREQLIKQLIKEKGGTREQYLQLLDSIAYHESAGTMDPTMSQYGGGPGRGVYQFEDGEGMGGITAAKRTRQYYEQLGRVVPSWLKNSTQSKSLDASKLSKEQQDVLFLGNMRQHPKANFSNVWDGKQSIADFWADNHWAGAKKDRKARIESFKGSEERFLQQIPTAPTAPIVNSPVAPAPTNHVVSPEPEFVNPMSQPYQPQAGPDKGGQYAHGGNLGLTSYGAGEVNMFNEGGTHEDNPHGGIPVGMGANGQPNTVEQHEAMFDLPNKETKKREKFIYASKKRISYES